MCFSDIPRAFIHKLRAFIGEPKTFFARFMWFTDLNKGMLNIVEPPTKQKQPRGDGYGPRYGPYGTRGSVIFAAVIGRKSFEV